ncbi:histidine phosphatase family protein [Enterococcus sp. BWR-S5]|uniref:histidine phosphatase family protein n=1 Tax=Enterococcus sp. BWR-S5 TaxID=2787714 RepID=UPI0019209736|nr:histidine phosphatase family protein [Enterococcus sp. BWR-S5]MBL1226759.1 histidine phosphatase family protein [Enterococcus sp. BWR-S5]
MNVKKLLVGMAATALLLTGCAGGADKVKTAAETKQEEVSEVTIYFARHGETMMNAVERAQGWTDAPLTPEGISGAEALGKGLKAADITFDKVYTSTSGRTQETAELILANNGQEDMTYTTDTRLREYNFGTYEGMKNKEMLTAVAEVDGESYEEFVGDLRTNGYYPKVLHLADVLSELDQENVEEGKNWPAEDSQTILDRLFSALDDIVADAEKEGHENVLIVSHGMSIITILGQLDTEEEYELTSMKNASISTIVHKEGEYRVTSANDVSYITEEE